MVAQALIKLLLLFLDLFARGVICANQQVADDPALTVAQRGHRYNGWETAPVLADVGQFINVLDPARGLEDEGFEPRCDCCFQLQA